MIDIDHPDLRPDQCRVCLVVNPGQPPAPPRRIKAHCREPVVNTDLQICAKHQAERERLVALFGEAS